MTRVALFAVVALSAGCSFILDPDDLGKAGLSVEAPALFEGLGAFPNTPGVPLILQANESLVRTPPECTVTTPVEQHCFTDTCSADGTEECAPEPCVVVATSDSELRAGLLVRLPLWASEEPATLTIAVGGRTVDVPAQGLPEISVGVQGQDFESVALSEIADTHSSCFEVLGSSVDVEPLPDERGDQPISAPLRLRASAGFIIQADASLAAVASTGSTPVPGPGGWWGGGLQSAGYGPGGGHGGQDAAVGAHATEGNCVLPCQPYPEGNGVYNQVARLVGGSGGGGSASVEGGNGGGAVALLTPGAILAPTDDRVRPAVSVLGRCTGPSNCGSSGTAVIRAGAIIGQLEVDASGRGNTAGDRGGDGRIRTELGSRVGTVSKDGQEALQSGPAFPTNLPRIVAASSYEVRLASGSADYPLLVNGEEVGLVSLSQPLTIELDPGLSELCTLYPETPEGASPDTEPESYQCIHVAYVTD